MSGRAYMGIPREKIPWFPKIDDSLCTNCGACFDFCSNGVFARGDTAVTVANPYNCVVGCSACRSECPSGALAFPEQSELVRMLGELRTGAR
jgi:NAD-dependent dihydropyrimidine dehydrogenase PreA subunit